MNLRRSEVSTFRAWFLICAGLISAVLIKPVQDHVDARLGAPSKIADILYFASPKVVRSMALGCESLLADIYWMRAIQYYGRREEAEKRMVRYGNLAALLDITTTLDPDLLDAYRFGAIFLSEPEPLGAGQPHEAIKLMDKGIIRHPLAWRLHFDKGFIFFWHMKDYKKAGEVWLAASRLASAPPWMEALAARALSQSGAVETARALWQRQYQESNRADVKENARNHLISMEVDEQRWTLEFFVEKYRKKFGMRPPRLESLVGARFLKFVPKDPSGVPYQYDRSTGGVRLSPTSKVRYLKMQYDYRDAYWETLVRMYGPN